MAAFGAIVFFASASLVPAHSCQDESRVRCVAVQPHVSVPDSTHGMGAHGYPMCTTDGQKVHCLANHDYHRCPEGQAPCCADGSNPSHSQDYVVHNNLICSLAAPPVVLDNMDQSVVTHKEHMEEGSFEPCMVDAFNGQFHHDWARNKGSASITFEFDPPESGCYMVEEYHPGSKPECAQYLPYNAKLQVDYCKGLTTTLTINQRLPPAQWNKVQSFMFYKGFKGRLTMRNSEYERCDADKCFLVADAFRMTKVGETCVLKDPVREQPDGEGKDGVLTMSARSMKKNDDVDHALRKNQPTLEVTLAANLGYQTVTMVDFVVQGRRLAAHPIVRVEAPFRAFNQLGDPMPAKLTDMLNAALASRGLEVLEASVKFAEAGDGDGVPVIWIVLGAIAGAVVCVSAAVFAVARCRRKPAEEVVKEEDTTNKVKVQGKTVEDAESPEIPEKDPQQMKWEAGSGSTGTPVEDTKSDSSPVAGTEPGDAPAADAEP